MIFLSEQLDNFLIIPSFRSWSNSAVTLSCRLFETRQHFWCFVVKFWRSFGLATCVFDKPILKTRLRNRQAIALFACCWTTARPPLLKRSLPKMSLWPWFATVRLKYKQVFWSVRLEYALRPFHMLKQPIILMRYSLEYYWPKFWRWYWIHY